MNGESERKTLCNNKDFFVSLQANCHNYMTDTSPYD